MDNNILIKYILISLILYGIFSSLENSNKMIILVFILLFFIYYNQGLLLRQINFDKVEINDYEFNPIFIKLKEYKDYNKNSYNLIIKNTEEFLNIYKLFSKNEYTSEHITSADDLKNNILYTLDSILINIPTKEHIDLEHKFVNIKNNFKFLLNKYMKKIVKINNSNWKKNTNNMKKPFFINHPKPFNY